MLKLFACLNSGTNDPSRFRVTAIWHIHSGDVLHADIGHILGRNSNRVSEERRAKVDKKVQVGLSKVGLRQRDQLQMVVPIRKA